MAENYKLAAPTLTVTNDRTVTVTWTDKAQSVTYPTRARGTQDTCPEVVYKQTSVGGSSSAHISGYDVQWEFRTQASGSKWQLGGVIGIGTSNVRATSFTAPAEALDVRVRVKAKSTTYTYYSANKTVTKDATRYSYTAKDYHYFTGVYSDFKTHDFSMDKPATPAAPTLTMNADATKATVVCASSDADVRYFTLDSDSDFNVTTVQTAEHTYDMPRGRRLRVRCKAMTDGGVRSADWSPWSGYVYSACAVPTIAKVEAVSANSVKVTLNGVDRADHYEVRYAHTKDEIKGDDYQTKTTADAGKTIVVDGLESGTSYWFGVRAYNHDGIATSWSASVKGTCGTAPDAPTVTLDRYVATSIFKAAVTHNATDDSEATAYDVQVHIVNAAGAESTWGSYSVSGDVVTVSTTQPGTYKVRARTKGAIDAWGAWSGWTSCKAYLAPMLSASVAGDTYPVTVALDTVADPTQNPIAYDVSIVADEDYDYMGIDGEMLHRAKGEEIAYKHVKSTAASRNVTFDFDDGFIAPWYDHVAKATVSLSSGLTAEATDQFALQEVQLDGTPTALIQDADAYAVTVYPTCRTAKTVSGETVTEWNYDDCRLRVYRVNKDGSNTFIKEVPNNGKNRVRDPHPTLNEQTYRIVAVANAAIVAEESTASHARTNSLVIQWDEAWDDNDTSTLRDDTYTGEMVELPYNPGVNAGGKPSVQLVEYSGRKNPVAYYGTQQGKTATYTADLPLDEADTIAALMRLRAHMGTAYIRDPMGDGMKCAVEVQLSYGSKSTVHVAVNAKAVE